MAKRTEPSVQTAERKQRRIATGIQKYRTADGDRWRVRYRDTAGRQRSKTFRTRGEADAFQSTNSADIVRGDWVDSSKSSITFEEYARDTYLPSRDWRPGTTEQAEIHLRKWIFPVLGRTPLAKVTPTQLDALTVKCRKAGLAASTVEIIYTRATNILKAAHADGLIRSAPRGTSRPRRNRARHEEEVVPLTRDQVGELVESAGDLSAFVWTMLGAGLRPGEAAGLTADRVDFGKLEIRVERALKSPNVGAMFLGDPKTEASRRTVPIGERLAEVLTEHIDSGAGTDLDGERLMFASRRGGALRRSTLGDYWHRWRPDGCVARGWHVCRHTYASALIEAGESIKVVQARLGHASAEETLTTYAHLMPDNEDRSRSALDDFMKGS